MSLTAAGLQLRLPPGWDAALRRQPPVGAQRSGNALLHAATIPLPAQRGDFGSGVVDRLGPDDAFVALLEYDVADADQALFQSPYVPVPRPSDFSPDALQRTVPGRSGAQWFFTAAGRAFTLHAALGSHARRAAGAVRVAALLAGLQIGPRS